MKEFLAEGMKRYKEASRLMVLFGENIEQELQQILSKRTKWGSFVSDKVKKTRSTKYWHQYPLLNADIFGKINGKACTIRISISWYNSETEYPFYDVRVENGATDEILRAFNIYEPSQDGFTIGEKSVSLYPNPKDFNLSRDFNLIIDEFIRIISKKESTL